MQTTNLLPPTARLKLVKEELPKVQLIESTEIHEYVTLNMAGSFYLERCLQVSTKSVKNIFHIILQTKIYNRITPIMETLNFDNAYYMVFWYNRVGSFSQISKMSEQTALLPKVIKHWFRNTLFKERQRNKDSPYNFSVPPSTQLNLEEYEKTGTFIKYISLTGTLPVVYIA